MGKRHPLKKGSQIDLLVIMLLVINLSLYLQDNCLDGFYKPRPNCRLRVMLRRESNGKNKSYGKQALYIRCCDIGR